MYKTKYTENYKTLLREIKEDLNKCRYIPCLPIEWYPWVKISMIFKLICRVKAMPVKISTCVFLSEIDKLILKFTTKCRRPRIAKTTLKEHTFGWLMPFDLMVYYKNTLIETMGYGHQDKQIDK